jgi:O-antigen ligase
MALVIILFLISLVFGQIGGIPVAPGVFVYVHDLMLGVFLLTTFSTLKKKKGIVPVLTTPILSFCAFAIFSLLINAFLMDVHAVALGSLYLFRFMAYASIYMVLSQAVVPGVFLLRGLYAFGIGVVVFGLIQYLLYPNLRFLMYMGWDPHYYRLFSTFFDPNFAGIIIVLTFFLGMQLWKQKHQLYITIGNTLALFLTYSRSSYLAFIAGLVTYSIFEKKWKMLVVATIFVFLVVIVPKPGGNTLMLTRMESTLARIGNWQESLAIIAQSPGYGHGFNTLRFVREQTQEDFGYMSRAGAGLDSSILFLLATTGIIGTVLYGWIITRVIIFYGKLSKPHVLLQMWLTILVGLLVHSLFTNSLFYPWVMIWIWVYLAANEVTSRT